ncbi:hypothetical protein EV182_007567, partial [Spiromyces aspiralis]
MTVLAVHFFAALSHAVQLSYIPAFAKAVGASTSSANDLLVALNCMSATGMVAAGYVADMIQGSYQYLLSLSTALAGILTLAMWVPATGYAALAVYTILYGACAGVYFCALPIVLLRLFGVVRGIVLLGYAFLLAVVPSSVSALFIGNAIYHNETGSEQNLKFLG